MSACIHCGECCRTMSPLSCDPEHEPCPRLQMIGAVAFCTDYRRRPAQCREHDFAFVPVCPIGKDVLKLDDVNHLAAWEHRVGEVLRDYYGEEIE